MKNKGKIVIFGAKAIADFTRGCLEHWGLSKPQIHFSALFFQTQFNEVVHKVGVKTNNMKVNHMGYVSFGFSYLRVSLLSYTHVMTGSLFLKWSWNLFCFSLSESCACFCPPGSRNFGRTMGKIVNERCCYLYGCLIYLLKLKYD